jgi:hypothetical protein
VPAGGHADLSLVHERSESADRCGLFEVDVIHDDQRIVAAEFKMSALEMAARQFADRASSSGRPGECDDANARMNHDCLTGVSAARQHAEHSGGQACFFEDASENHTAADRRARVRLENHRIAQRQCGSDCTDRQNDGEVERRDDADGSDGYATREAQPRLLRAQNLADRVRGQSCCVVALFGSGMGFQPGLGRDAAGLADYPFVDFVGVLLEQLTGAA